MAPYPWGGIDPAAAALAQGMTTTLPDSHRDLLDQPVATLATVDADGRPQLYGSRYEALLANRAAEGPTGTYRIAGKHCEQGDVLVHDACLPADVAVGDILATPVTGAYAHSMASNYNKVLRPAVVFVQAGHSRLVVRREEPGDLIRLDAP